MILASLLLVAAALLTPGQMVLMDLAVAPDAAGKRPIAFDAPGFRAAVALQLAQAGVMVGAGQGMTRLVIRVTSYDPGNGIAFAQTARMSAQFQLVPARGAPSPELSVACEGKAKFDLGTPGARARRAHARCLDELAAAMVHQLMDGGGSMTVK